MHKQCNNNINNFVSKNLEPVFYKIDHHISLLYKTEGSFLHTGSVITFVVSAIVSVSN